MGRRRRRRGPGSGSGRGASRRRASRRRILITSVGPTGDVSSASPTIRATVEDRDGNPLSRHDIDVYLDGEDKRFTYRRATGDLKCPTGRLSSGTHTVEIEAYVETDDGGSRTGRNKWTFNVKK
jgi:hypothetical protein